MSFNSYQIYIYFSLIIIKFSNELLVFCKDPEVNMNISEIIRYNGYVCEDHHVITEDGYILSMQRIPFGKINKYSKKYRLPILLQHGFLDSAHTFANNLPHQSLAFILADNGYDVYLLNSRGSTYSTKHISLNDKDPAFWKFSWDEMAKYDLPAFVAYALNKSGNVSKLAYIGHSQGTQIMFARLPQDAWLRGRISAFVGLGPATFLSNVEAGFKFLARFRNEIEKLLNLFGHGRIMSNSEIFRYLASTLCSEKGFPKFCAEIIFLIAGNDMKNMNQSRLPIYISHTPAGTSVMNLIHQAQAVNSGEFQMYDYGIEGNIEHYNSTIPPQYLVQSVGIPTALFSGGKDTLADPTDVDKLVSLLKDDVKLHKRIDYYNHMDFVWGEDAYQTIYGDLLDFLKKYA